MVKVNREYRVINMKVIGILGGLAPESTAIYYDHIIRTYYDRFKNYNYPEIIIYSVDFQKYVDWQNTGNWSAAAEDMTKVIKALHSSGADFGIIATNTMHKVFDEVQENSPIHIVSIMEATAEKIQSANFTKVGLLGTIFTMQESFYKDALAEKGIEVIVPDDNHQKEINRIIYEELTHGEIKTDSKKHYVNVVKKMEQKGAQGVILGCTEIPLIINEGDCRVTLFNTTIIHAEKALDYALGK